MLIQTALPEHYAIQAALAHDSVASRRTRNVAFATRELKERRHPAYPPMVRLVNVVVSSPVPENAAGNAEEKAMRQESRQLELPLEDRGEAPRRAGSAHTCSAELRSI